MNDRDARMRYLTAPTGRPVRMVRRDSAPTPFDQPVTLWDRLIFPSLRMAYRRGLADGQVSKP